MASVMQVGWSPTYTLTEDFALGMELKKNKWHCRYLCEYLAVGEAPDQIRNCFQQRSRWTKVLPQLNLKAHPWGPSHAAVHSAATFCIRSSSSCPAMLYNAKAARPSQGCSASLVL